MKPIQNTEQVIAKATQRVSNDMATLSTRRDGALSAFRRARAELQAVNVETPKGIRQIVCFKRVY